MQISSTNNSVYSVVSKTQTTSQNVNSSFNTLVNTQNQDTASSISTVRTPKIVEFLDAHKGFSSLSPTDEKIFREILSDNKLTKEEANSLSFEQVERITTLLTQSDNLTKEEWGNMPIVQEEVDLTAIYATGNRQFNEAYYNTLKELDDKDASILRNEVGNNLAQLYSGKELRPTFTEPSYLPNAWEYQDMDADFGKFIKNVINHHNSMIANPNVASGCKEQLKDVLNVYDVLEKNYNQMLSKTKYV